MARQASTPSVTYVSPCGRLRLEQHGPKDLWIILDEALIGCRSFQYVAMSDGHTALCEALAAEAIWDADAVAEYAEVA